jgi:hypothetical protein
VIGAGSSGITALKGLAEAGLDVTCFEATDRVGGLWVFRGTPDTAGGYPKTAAYRSLHINTSRRRMAYSDFPMPESYPDFPSHEQIAEYFDAYVDRFALRRRIRFDAAVARCEKVEGARWRVTLASGEALVFDALLVANGHHWDPAYPEPPFPGRFDGRVLHSHDYVDEKGFEGRRVLVVGMGNSAMDIACETSRVARRVLLSARRGAHVVPKYLFGRPIDEYPALLKPWVPFAVRQGLGRAMLRLAVGKVERYGLPKPDHELGQAHPTISDEILSRLTHGAVVPKANVAELAGGRVRFDDGSIEEVDVIVYCTGYKVTFPFFDPSFLSAPDNDLPLYKRVFKPGEPTLAFVALLQPLGAMMPLAEAQGRLLADYLLGRYALPSETEMRDDIERDRRAMTARYVASRRHTMQVDFDDYLHELEQERARGAARAARLGHPRPIS